MALISPESVAKDQGSLSDGAEDGRIALLEDPNWHIILGDVRAFLVDDISDRLSAVSSRGRVFCIIAESTSGGLVFELHENGKVRRKWMEVDGVVTANLGEPLPEEPHGLFTDSRDADGERDFWKAVTVAEGVTGLQWNAIQCSPSEVHRAIVSR